MIHICTSSHRQGTARIVTPVGHRLSVVPAPCRRRCRSEREAEARGTVVRLFPKEKQTKPTPQASTHSQEKPHRFSPKTSLIPSLGMVFPTEDSGESHGKDESKGLPTSSPPWPSAAGGVAAFTSCLQPKKKHWMGVKMLHIGGEKNPQNPTLPSPLKKTPPF